MVELADDDRDEGLINNVGIADEVVDMQWVSLEDLNEETCHRMSLPVIEALRKK